MMESGDETTVVPRGCPTGKFEEERSNQNRQTAEQEPGMGIDAPGVGDEAKVELLPMKLCLSMSYKHDVQSVEAWLSDYVLVGTE